MLKRIKNVPLDYSLCNMTVTLYRRNGFIREILEGVHYEFTNRREKVDGVIRNTRSFLLVIPGGKLVSPGDMVMLGIGPKFSSWESLRVADNAGMGLITSVQPRYYKGKICHYEARGEGN